MHHCGVAGEAEGRTMTTDTTDAAARHRELRAQWIEQLRADHDGHGRRSIAGANMDELRKRAKRRRQKQRARTWRAQLEDNGAR